MSYEEKRAELFVRGVGKFILLALTLVIPLCVAFGLWRWRSQQGPLTGHEQALSIFVVTFVAGMGWAAGGAFYNWTSGMIGKALK